MENCATTSGTRWVTFSPLFTAEKYRRQEEKSVTEDHCWCKHLFGYMIASVGHVNGHMVMELFSTFIDSGLQNMCLFSVHYGLLQSLRGKHCCLRHIKYIFEIIQNNKKRIKNTNGNTGETRWGRWRTSWSCRVVNWANWYIVKRPRNQRKHTGDQMKKSYVASPVQLVPSSFDLVSRVSPLAPYPFYNVITSPVILVANSK